MDTTIGRNGTIESYCISVGEKEHGKEHILESITTERPQACRKASATVFRKVLDDFYREENSTSLSFSRKTNSGPQKAQGRVAPTKSFYPVPSKHLTCSINSQNNEELQARGGPD